MNRKSTRSLIVALSGVLAVFGLSACGSDGEQKSSQVIELEKRGFSDVTGEVDGAEWGVYYASAGSCRLKIRWEKTGEKAGYTLVEKSSQGEASDLTVEEPSLIKLKQLAPLAYCFETEQTPTSAAPPSN